VDVEGDMNKGVSWALLLTAFISTLLWAGDAFSQTPAGTVSSLTGDAHVERAGTTVPATVGMALDAGDRVVTASNSRVTITLTDNSKLELDESTSLVIDQQMVTANSRNTKLSLFSGLVRSFVSYTSSPTPNFEVHTPNAVASARGTEYDTGTDTRERKEYKGCRRFTQVLVYQGVVGVTNSTNPGAGTVNVPAGHKTLVACGFAPEPPSEISAAGAAGAGSAGAGTAAAGAAAAATGGSVASSTTGMIVGGTIVAGGLAGGIAASVGGGSSSSGKPISPKH
jgi:FecR protein